MKINSTNNTSFKSLATQKIAQNVAEYMLKFRRPFKGETLAQAEKQHLLSVIQEKTLPFIEKEEPIKMVIVGFPMKCPNTEKVVAQYADRAEYESLKHLDSITKGVSDIYKPGANLDIFSDGRIFVGLIFGSSDHQITRYVLQLKDILKNLGSKNLKIRTLDDFYSGSYDSMRMALKKDFPAQKSAISDDKFVPQYRAFMRDFYAKDVRAQDKNISIKQSKVMGEKIAEEIINASNSLSDFIKNLYKNAMLRLSIHANPVNNSNNKIGIFLNSLNDSCPSPWHGAAIKIPQKDGSEKFLFEKKFLLEKAGAKFVPNKDGKGYYFEFPENISYDNTKSLKENISAILK